MDRCFLSRFLFPVFLLVLSCAAPAHAADNPASQSNAVKAGGFICFSLTPPRDRPSSCDAVCATKSAVCTSVTLNGAFNPGIGCETAADPKYFDDTVASCRCCALGK